VHTLKIYTYTHRVVTLGILVYRLFKIFDNNTGIHNMLKYKHNTFNRKIKVYTKAFYKINGMLKEINF
jgi:hypothetical protein